MEESQVNIGVLNEYRLHAQLKDRYCGTTGKTEVKINNYFIDVVQADTLIEIQSQNFSQIKRKLLSLLQDGYKVRLVYPLIMQKWFITKTVEQETKKRKSPKRMNVFYMFRELVSITDVIPFSSFELEVLMLTINEYRQQLVNHPARKRKKSYKIVNRELVEVKKIFTFKFLEDFLFIFPVSFPKQFSTKEIMTTLNLGYKLSSQIVYTLNKIGVIELVGKKGNRKYYQRKNTMKKQQ